MGLSWHLFKNHQVRPPLRALVESTHCAACLQEFHSRERVIRHVSRSSPKCIQVYIQAMAPMHIDDLGRFEEEAYNTTRQLKTQGFRREHAQLPPIRLVGPLIIQSYSAGISHITLLKCAPRGRARAPPIHQAAIWPTSDYYPPT